MSYHIKVTCKFCRTEFLAQRKTAKFCYDKDCRQKFHRLQLKSVDAPLSVALHAINTISNSISGYWSYDAIRALKTIINEAEHRDLTHAGSWWRCSKCHTTRRRKLPPQGDCNIGGVHEWRLQHALL